jgi:hypothetical protein
MKTRIHLVNATMLVASILLLAACASPATGGSDTTAATSSSASTSSFANVVSGVKNFLQPIAGVSKGASPSAGPASGVATTSGAAQASNGPIGVPAAAPGFSTKDWPANEGCRIVPSYTSTLDVDTIYARAMRAYSFRSIEQEQIRSQVDRLQWTETNYLHESHPGAYYHLRQSVAFKLEPVDRHSIWMELEIVKNGTGSDVSIKYCYTTRDASAGTIAFHAALQKRFRAELG